MALIDWTAFHFLNDLLIGHALIGDELEDFTFWSVPALAAATVGLWLVSRPGAVSRWRLAAASAVASAGLALLTNQVISHIWHRARPTEAHADAHLWFVHASHDPSFPSDHAAASFAIAVSVLLVSRRAGAAFLVAAAAISVTRVLVGLHYPGDVLGGALVGTAAALAVHHLARRPLGGVVRALGRVTDPLLAPVWRLGGSRGYPKRPLT
ncbi:MAG TPA: phosphatase PAP2 family protein [Miltoncostaeaceae bacterium]|nr:phosphatase PAP2 family protein [Miltoncostaeaceae bacterium]